MSDNAIVPADNAAAIESVVINGDLSKLTPAQRVSYYQATCKSLGLNPLTRPFDYITLNGKLTLYARKDCTDQLRQIKHVSMGKPDIVFQDDWIIVTITASDSSGRSDSDVGAVNKKDMRGDFGNALMKAVTKAKRRVTLSICGLGMLDETEVETIPDARVVPAELPVISNNGQKPTPPPEPEQEPVFDNSLPVMEFDTACNVKNSKGMLYGDIDTGTLAHMANSIRKELAKKGAHDDNEIVEYQYKLSAIQTILAMRQATN